LCVFAPFPIKVTLEPNYLESLAAPLELAGPITQLIHEYKYNSVKPIGKLLGQLLFYTADIPKIDAVTWVPLHPQRQEERGYNQAEEIARQVAHLAKLPALNLLIRAQPTSSQAKLKTREERLQHLAMCFKPATDLTQIPRRVLLIDDVTTTGTTLNECAKVLKQLGILEVHGLVVAHGN
jgi:ComF family protein